MQFEAQILFANFPYNQDYRFQREYIPDDWKWTVHFNNIWNWLDDHS